MTGQPFLALITPIGGGGGAAPPGVNWPTFPSNPIAEPPWGWGRPPPGGGAPGGGGQPSHPIWGPPGFNPPGAGMPPGIWGGRPPNYVDIGGPGPQPPGTPPLTIWGGGGVGNYPDAGFPGPQPGRPPQIWGGPYFPPVIWDPASPTNPIVSPGDPDHPGGGRPATPKIEWKTAWSPETGWVVVGVPTGEHVTPSEQPK